MDNTNESRAGEAAPIAANKDNTTNSGDAGRMVRHEPRQQRKKSSTSTRLREITELLHGRIGQIATELHGAPTASTATTRRHSEKQGLLINLAQQDWHDFRSGRGGDAFSLIIWSKGYTQDEAVEWVREFVGRTPDSPAVPAAPERDDPEPGPLPAPAPEPAPQPAAADDDNLF